MDLMVKTTMAIQKEMNDARNIRDAGVVKDKRKESQLSTSGSRKKQKTSTPQGFQGQGQGYQSYGQGRSFPGGKSFMACRQLRQGTCYHYHHPGHLRRDCP